MIRFVETGFGYDHRVFKTRSKNGVCGVFGCAIANAVLAGSSRASIYCDCNCWCAHDCRVCIDGLWADFSGHGVGALRLALALKIK